MDYVLKVNNKNIGTTLLTAKINGLIRTATLKIVGNLNT